MTLDGRVLDLKCQIWVWSYSHTNFRIPSSALTFDSVDSLDPFQIKQLGFFYASYIATQYCHTCFDHLKGPRCVFNSKIFFC